MDILLYVFSFISKPFEMSLSTNELMLAILIAVVLAGILAYGFYIQRKQAKAGMPVTKT